MLYEMIFFFVGLCIGSFINVVIFRLDKGESVIKLKTKNKKLKPARSHCPRCQHKIFWYDLVPVLSFIMLGGKCRYCHKKISWQYPLVEILTGIIFLLIASKIFNFKFLILNQFQISNFKFQIAFVYWFYIASVLIIIFVYDLKHYIIPDKVLFPAIGVSFIYLLFQFFENSFIQNSFKIQNATSSLQATAKFEILLLPIAAAILASGFFLAIVLISRGRAMGLGDVKLAFFMGLILGWPDILVALFLAFALGAVVGLFLILISREPFSQGERFSKNLNSRYSLKSKLPFAPFLIIGTFIALFWGEKILFWYINILM